MSSGPVFLTALLSKNTKTIKVVDPKRVEITPTRLGFQDLVGSSLGNLTNEKKVFFSRAMREGEFF